MNDSLGIGGCNRSAASARRGGGGVVE